MMDARKIHGAKVIAAFAVVYLIWGSTYAAIRVVVEQLPALATSGVRFVLAGVIFHVLARIRAERPLSLKHCTGPALSGLLMLTASHGLVCYAEQTMPSSLAAVLMAKGVSPGAALVFLLVGPATNMASLLVIGRRLGKRTAVVYLGSLVAAALVIASAVDAFMDGWNWIPKIADPSIHEHFNWFNWIGSAMLALGFLHVWQRQFVRRFRSKVDAKTA